MESASPGKGRGSAGHVRHFSGACRWLGSPDDLSPSLLLPRERCGMQDRGSPAGTCKLQISESALSDS